MAGGTLQRFWTEVRRRHVPRVAAYYIAGAWVLAQAGSLLLDAFDENHYTRYLIAALGAGLPVALVLAWIFDITPRGIERTLSLKEPSAATPSLPASPAPEHSIAVLPFANLSDDPANEYFSDGLSEEIRNQLARVEGLRVAARTSAFAFKGRNEDVREIARRLNVSTILEGGVRKHEDTVRIDVQLVSASDGFQLWSHTFERRLSDIFRLQNEVAQAVLVAVTARHGDVCAEPCPQTQNLEAYNWYLLGRHHFHKRSRASLQRAVECFEAAIAIDPDYALALCGVSDAHMLLSARYYGSEPVAEAVAKALPAARRAMAREPMLAETHASMGLIRLSEGESSAAEVLLLRAIELNPNYLLGHLWLGLVLTAQGRYREAADRNREALRLDPLAPIVNTNVGFDAQRFGDSTEAVARFDTAVEIDSAFAVAYSGLSRQAMLRGDFAEALRRIDQAIERAPARVYFAARKGLMFLQLGRIEEAARWIDIARQKVPASEFDRELILALRMACGDRDALAEAAADEAYTVLQRGQAALALGDRTAARAYYEQGQPDARREIDEILNDDWMWRMPHWINRAHLRMESGDPRGRDELERYVAEAERVGSEGLVHGDVRYYAATAHALLGRTDIALATLESALQAGWRHPWWTRLDWNLQGLAQDSRFADWLARLGPSSEPPRSAQ